MGNLARQMQRAQAKRNKSKSKPQLETGRAILPDEAKDFCEGIFCDCHGTLFSHAYEKDELLVAYLNAQHAAGRTVMLISTHPMDVVAKIKNIGLHADIVKSLCSKERYHYAVLEELIDDDSVMLSSKQEWHPHDKSFRQHMQSFLDRITPAPNSLNI